MPRQLGTKRRHLHHAHRFTLILAILVTPGFARIAAAAAPVFQGTFTSVDLCSPRGIGLSPSGDVFVGSDCGNPLQHMAHFTAAGTLVGTWTFGAAYSGPPNGVAVDGAGNVFVAGSDGGYVLKFSNSGALTTIFAAPSYPVDIAVDGSGNVFVVELDGKRVQKFTNTGAFLTTIGSAGTGPGQFQSPVGVAVDASGRLYVADARRGRILRFLANGSFDMEFTSLGAPYDMAVGPDGNIYVIGDEVYQYSPSGVLLLSSSSPYGLYLAFRIAISPTGAIFITEQNSNRITKFQIDQTTSATRTTFGRLKAMYR